MQASHAAVDRCLLDHSTSSTAASLQLRQDHAVVAECQPYVGKYLAGESVDQCSFLLVHFLASLLIAVMVWTQLDTVAQSTRWEPVRHTRAQTEREREREREREKGREVE